MFDVSFSWLLTNLAAAVLLPPLNGLLPMVLGLLAMRRRPRLARLFIATGLVLIALQSLGLVSRALTAPLEAAYPPIRPAGMARIDVDAIVVLGAGRYRNGPEFGEDDVGGGALDRLRYAAMLARESGKPLLVTGGAPDGGSISEAEAMRRSLERDFRVKVRWLESASNNTLENARYSANLLQAEGVKRVALVTHAWHMPRSVGAFQAAGFSVLPAPTAYSSLRALTAFDFVPSAGALQGSARALHEWIGILWYRLRH